MLVKYVFLDNNIFISKGKWNVFRPIYSDNFTQYSIDNQAH